MMYPKNTLIAVYDALHELAHFADPDILSRARALGEGIGTQGVGMISRAGSPVTAACLASGGFSLLLSPAASETEHVRGFRLPKSDLPVIYAGRGALGADVAALASAAAIVIIGSDEEALLGILGCAEGRGIPIAILADPSGPDTRAVAARYPSLAPLILVSEDPASLLAQLFSELRKRHLAAKI